MEDDEAANKNSEQSESETPEADYVFEGFKVDFSEKIALTPPTAEVKGQTAA